MHSREPPAFSVSYSYTPPTSNDTDNKRQTIPPLSLNYEIPPPPTPSPHPNDSTLHTAPAFSSVTHQLSFLRSSVADAQNKLNAHLTQCMEIEKPLAPAAAVKEEVAEDVEEEEEYDEETKALEAEVMRERAEEEEEEKKKIQERQQRKADKKKGKKSDG